MSIDVKKYVPLEIVRTIENVSFRKIEGEGNQNKFSISFSSETPCMRWGEKEILLHTAEAVNLDRLKEIGVLLYAHGQDKNYGRLPIGGIENIVLDEQSHRCTADIVFDEDDERAMLVCQKVQKGYIKGVSVGYRVMKWIILQENETTVDKRFTGPCALAVEWEPFEISVEPLAADPTVGIGRSIEESIIKNGEGKIMPEKREISTPAATTVVPPVATPEHDVVAEERARAAEIMTRCAAHGMDPTPFITNGSTVADVNESILRTLEKQNKPVGTAVTIVAEEEDKFRSAAVDGLLLRGGVKVGKASDGANEFRGMRLRDIAMECMARQGGDQNIRRMNDEALFRGVITPDSAFVSILDGAINKSMGVAYQAAETTYQLWTGKDSNPDFKAKKIYNISEAGNLVEVKQNGEFTADEVKDSGVTSVLATFGKTFGFTRQSLINDDLSVLTKVPDAYARAAKRGINKAVYNILKSNPTMADGKTLFCADHKNLGTGAAPSTPSYQQAYGGMMHQKNQRGIEALNIPPKFVICDPMQFAEHAAMIRSVADPSGNNSGKFNPFAGALELVMDAELFTSDAIIPYFFAADPSGCDTITVSYLNGNEEPTLESRVGFEFLGIQYRIFIDYGVTLVDYRGLHKNPGKPTV